MSSLAESFKKFKEDFEEFEKIPFHLQSSLYASHLRTRATVLRYLIDREEEKSEK